MAKTFIDVDPIYYVFAAGLAYVLLKKVLRRDTVNNYPLPPGPKGKPIINNLLDLPAKRPWEAATEWSKDYGDIVYVDVAGNKLVFVNSVDIAVELFEKRSSNYSDRIQSSMMKLMELDWILPFTRYGDDWRTGRRIFHQEFNLKTASKFAKVQEKYVHNALNLIKEDPSSFEKHIKYFASGFILEMIYGLHIKSNDDPYMKAAEEGLEAAQGVLPGAFLVDAFPILMHVPEWMPGSGFKKKAKYWRQKIKDASTIPFEAVTQAYANGSAGPSFAASWLARIDNMPEGEQPERLKRLMQGAAATAHLAGEETTASALLNFVYFMLVNPQIQRKAHEELDRIIGRERLPSFEDRNSLKYIDAVCKEVLRIRPVAPLAVPHGTSDEDVYKEMRIPKGSAVFPNIWAMSHNEVDYGVDVDQFRPERFLEKERRDPTSYSFGFGRRVCPGRHVAANSLFIFISSILQMFEITRVLDDDGSEKPLNPRWVDGVTVHLAPYPASFKLRFEGAQRLNIVAEL